MIKEITAVIIFGICFFGNFDPLALAQGPQEKANAPAQEKLLAVGDVVSIKAWRKPDRSELEFEGDFTLDKQGMLMLPTIGNTKAADLTISQLKEGLSEDLKHYLKSPELEVSLKAEYIPGAGEAVERKEIQKILFEQISQIKKDRAKKRDDIVETPDGYDIGIKENSQRSDAVVAQRVMYSTIFEEKEPVEYKINLDDILDVTVWQNPEISKEVTVRPDGKITLLLAGDVQAQGMTTNELRDEITRKLSAFIINPQVAVMLKKFGGKRIVVLGQVTAPGVYTVPADAHLMEAIAMAGDFTKQAYQEICLARGDLYNNPRLFLINAYDISGRGRIDKNLLLERNDIIYVPRTKVYNVINLLTPLRDLLKDAYDSRQRVTTWQTGGSFSD